jgi:hypothetical protein
MQHGRRCFAGRRLRVDETRWNCLTAGAYERIELNAVGRSLGESVHRRDTRISSNRSGGRVGIRHENVISGDLCARGVFGVTQRTVTDVAAVVHDSIFGVNVIEAADVGTGTTVSASITAHAVSRGRNLVGQTVSVTRERDLKQTNSPRSD